MKRGIALGFAIALAVVAVAVQQHAWRHVEGDDDDDDDDDGAPRPEYWRAQIAIRGQGRVATPMPTFDCTPAGGQCGPKLVVFDERKPPLLHATGAPGWRFDHWESSLRKGAMPDGAFYLNGFGYSDTGETETVTAVFVPAHE